MPTLIDRVGTRPDRWTPAAAIDPEAGTPARGSWLIAAADWLARRDFWIDRAAAAGARLGLELSPTDDPLAIRADLPRLDLLAVNFPVFTDGRGYSIARQLRQLRWHGELRATGDILRDQLFYLGRCGFDSFALRDDQDVDGALASFSTFSEAYQAGFDRGALFERRRERPPPIEGRSAGGPLTGAAP